VAAIKAKVAIMGPKDEYIVHEDGSVEITELARGVIEYTVKGNEGEVLGRITYGKPMVRRMADRLNALLGY
jgi:hypothetical protein